MPGGRLVASGGSDRVVRLWDASSGRAVHEMSGHEDAVTAVAVGPKHLASASRDGTVRVWALEDGRCLGTLRGPPGPSPGRGARRRASPSRSPRARTPRCATGASIPWRPSACTARTASRSWPSPSRRTGSASSRAPPTGRSVPSRPPRSGSGRSRGWTAPSTPSPWRRTGPAGPHTGRWSAPFRPTGCTFLRRPCAGRPPPPRRRRAHPRSRRGSRRPAARSPRATCPRPCPSPATRAPSRATSGRKRPSPSGTTCARGSPRQALQSAWEDARLEGHEDQVLAVAVDRAGARALTAGLDATVRLWDLASRRHEVTLSGHDGAVTDVAFAGAGRAVSGGRDRTVRLWDLAGRQALAVLEGHEETVTAVDATARRPARGERELGRHRPPLGPPAPRGPARPRGPRGPRRGRPPLPRRPGRGQRGLGRHGAAVGRGLGTRAGRPGGSRRQRHGDRASRRRPPGRDGRRGRHGARVGRSHPPRRARARPDTRARSPGSPSRPTAGSSSRRAATAPSACGTCAEARPSARCPTRPSCWGSPSPPSPALSSPPAPTAARESVYLDWEPEIPVSPPAATPTARIGGDTVRTRVTAGAVPAPATTLREDLRRAAPIGIPVLPRAARAARRIPWGRVADRSRPPRRDRGHLARLASARRRPARVAPHGAGRAEGARPHRPRALSTRPAPRATTSGTSSGCAPATPTPATSRASPPGARRASWWTCSTALHSSLPSP